MNYSKIISFLAISLGLVWLSIFIANLFQVDLVGMFALSLFHIWAPGIAAFIVQKWVYRESLEVYGFSRKNFGAKWVLTSIFGPYALLVGVIGLVFVLGNLFNLPGFGFVVFAEGDAGFVHEVQQYLSGILPGTPEMMMPPELWILVVVLLVAGFFFGPTLGLITSLGEELGWRGLMVEETKKMGFLGSNLIIGSLWAIWYLPQFFRMSEATGSELFLSMLTFIGYCICFSFPLAYLSRKSQTVFGPAIFRGVFNIINIATFFFIWGENPMIGSATGLTGMFIFLTLTFLIIRYDPEFVENYANLTYTEKEV